MSRLFVVLIACSVVLVTGAGCKPFGSQPLESDAPDTEATTDTQSDDTTNTSLDVNSHDDVVDNNTNTDASDSMIAGDKIDNLGNEDEYSPEQDGKGGDTKDRE